MKACGKFNEDASLNIQDITCTGNDNISEILAIFKSKWPTEEWKQFGFFNDDYLLKINLFWLQFPPPSPSSHYFLAILYAIIMTVGVTGNFLVLIMYLRKRTLRTPANIFIMNLAVSDALMLLKMPVFIFNSLHLGPALGELGCAIYGFLGGLTGIVSIMTLSAIALDRYQVILHPLVRKTKQRIYIQILFIWLYGGFFSILPLLDVGLNRYVPEGYLTSCSFDYLTKDTSSRIAIAILFTGAWVVPFCIITTSYAAICKVILQVQKGQVNMDLSRHCKEIEIRRTEMKVAIVVIGVVSLWFISWTPYAIVALLGVTGHENYLTPSSSMIPALFCKMASCIDPFIYAVTHPRFRTELKNEFRRSQRFRMSKKSEKKETWLTISEVNAMPNRRSSDDLVKEMVVMVSTTKEPL